MTDVQRNDRRMALFQSEYCHAEQQGEPPEDSVIDDTLEHHSVLMKVRSEMERTQWSNSCSTCRMHDQKRFARVPAFRAPVLVQAFPDLFPDLTVVSELPPYVHLLFGVLERGAQGGAQCRVSDEPGPVLYSAAGRSDDAYAPCH